MENRKHTSSGVPTFDMIPMLMANLLEDNKILSAKLDAWLLKEGHKSQDDLRREAEEYVNSRRKNRY